MSFWIPTDLTLKGTQVDLIPLQPTHRADLLAAAADGQLWKLWYTSVPSEATIDQYITTALAQRTTGREIPFVVWHKASQAVIGTTRFYNLQPEHRRLEVGYTWYAKSHQRTGVNTECKYLLFQYAFETLNCIAVQLMTDWFNQPSREAITRLGATQDGILRNHRINVDGTYRNSVVFSILETEWQGVRKSLTMHMSR